MDREKGIEVIVTPSVKPNYIANTKIMLSFRGGILIPLGSLLVIFTLFGALAPDLFLTLTNAEVILTQASVLAVVGFGVTLVIISGSIDLSVGSVAGLA